MLFKDDLDLLPLFSNLIQIGDSCEDIEGSRRLWRALQEIGQWEECRTNTGPHFRIMTAAAKDAAAAKEAAASSSAGGGTDVGVLKKDLAKLILRPKAFTPMALRKVLVNCQPQARSRAMSFSEGIVAYPGFNMKSSLLPDILKVEQRFTQNQRLLVLLRGMD